MTSARQEPENQSTGSRRAPATAEPDELSVDWANLPEQVRSRLAEIAADAVGEIPSIDVPPPDRTVAKFAPAKRARLGATPLLTALHGNVGFRTSVTEWAREH